MGNEGNTPAKRLGLSHVHLKTAWIQGVEEDVRNLGRLEFSKKYPSLLVLISHLKVGPLPAVLNATGCLEQGTTLKLTLMAPLSPSPSTTAATSRWPAASAVSPTLLLPSRS